MAPEDGWKVWVGMLLYEVWFVKMGAWVVVPKAMSRFLWGR